MNAGTKISLITIGIIAITALLFFVNKQQNDPDNVFPLKRGSQNDEVLELQRYLNIESALLGVNDIAEDGIFGAETEARLYMITGKNEVSRIWHKNNVKYI